MITYSGICIGGGMDGMRLKADRPVYTTPLLSELPTIADMPEAVDVSVSMSMDAYAHTNMHFVDGKGLEEVGFWLHADYPTLKDALNHMADVYSNATKATRRK